VTDLEAARSTAARTGSGRLTFALRNIGWAHRQLGSLALARAALEQAHEAVVRAKDVQIGIFVRTELARVLATEDPPRAAALAAEAVVDARRLGYAVADALIAAGWIHLAAGDRPSATACAIEAVDEARAADEPPTLAEAIELRAMASDGSEQLALLREAHALWSELGDVPGRLRLELVLGERSPLAEERARGRAAARRLRDLGVRVEQAALAAGVLQGVGVGARRTLVVRVLGGFSVLVAGRPVPIAAWGSRKARDLLKILVAHRGRPVPRETLMEILWPGDDPEPLANRLAVAVATVRGVLDPERARGSEQYVGAEPESVWLRLDSVSVDVEAFLADTAAGQALLRQGRESDAVELLEAAEEAYAGDALEEDPYEDWSTGLREEARAAYIGVVSALAAIAQRRGDSEACARYLLRLLARDPYDEGAHLGLVATLDGAGRHGEARRRYRMYVERMRELEVEAAPFPTPPAPPG
jgi:DNA-binding SARP family transcriptional activator